MDDLDFSFKQLHAFITIIETGSFTAAAKKLAQTQSSISQLVASMEKNLNAELIDRSQRPIRLTVAGQELYQFGVKLLSDGRQLQEKIYAVSEGQLSHLRLGVVDSIGGAIGLEVLKHLHSRVKKVSQVTGTAPDLLDALQKGRIDLTLTMMHAQASEQIKLFPLMDEEYLIVTPKTWPESSLEQLCKKFDYIAYAGWTPTGAQTINWLKWRSLTPRVQFEISQADDALELIATGYGWTLATPLFLACAPHVLSALRFTPLPKPSLYRSLVAMCRDGELSSFTPVFASDVKAMLSSVLEPEFAHLFTPAGKQV